MKKKRDCKHCGADLDAHSVGELEKCVREKNAREAEARLDAMVAEHRKRLERELSR